MGFVVSVLYFVTYYLTPPTLFGPLAGFRIELTLAFLLLIVSLAARSKSIILNTPQSLALVGLALAISLSVLFGEHWAGGVIAEFLAFVPCAFAYLLVSLHCNSRKKLQVVVLMLLGVCLFVIANGFVELHYGVPQTASLGPGASTEEVARWNVEHPYILRMTNEAGESLYRLQGLGLINDPNDFGQLVVCVIPLTFIFWRPRKFLRNLVLVLLPVCVLLYGSYLTHSRGALVALTAIAIVLGRRRIGTLPALLIAGGVFVTAMSLHFTGGRDISAGAGADRTELWSDGLQLLKSHPLFGVGPGIMPELTQSHRTAHNSMVVCAAELGSFGLYFWCLFLFPTLRDALTIASSKKVSDAEETVLEERPFFAIAKEITLDSAAELNSVGRLLVLSLTGFLIAGWFLSRTLVLTFFLLGGMVEVVYEMALERGMIVPRQRLSRALLSSGALAVGLVMVMYITLRILNLTH